MIAVLFAMAMAATPPAAVPDLEAEALVDRIYALSAATMDMNLKQPELAHCDTTGERQADTKDKAKTQTPLWTPKDYPEAGAYRALTVEVGGCAVPVPANMSRDQAIIQSGRSPGRTLVLMNGKPLK